MDLFSYVVRYDSGFAPNPFYGFCTLATCKPPIRKSAKVGDWIVGCGSASQEVQRGGRLVYAMKIKEILTFNEYFTDSRFQRKKPILTGSRKQARGDNIYQKMLGSWSQLDSFHSQDSGKPNPDHITRDTGVDRVLISDEYVYFGGNGPDIPEDLRSADKLMCHKGIGRSRFQSSNSDDQKMIDNFVVWIRSVGLTGYSGHPFDWIDKQ